jgi:hypothetical protein
LIPQNKVAYAANPAYASTDLTAFYLDKPSRRLHALGAGHTLPLPSFLILYTGMPVVFVCLPNYYELEIKWQGMMKRRWDK